MDFRRTRRASYESRSGHAAASSRDRKRDAERYFLIRSLGKVASKRKAKLWERFRKTEFAKWPDKSLWHRIYASFNLVLLVLSILIAVVQPFINDTFYNVTPAVRGVLPDKKQHLATYLSYDAKENGFIYNKGYTGQSNDQVGLTGQGTPRITAAFGKEPTDGVTINDPANQLTMRMVPQFKVSVGKQDANQLFYPLVGQPGYLVYSAQTASIKEDIVLEKATKDEQTFAYDLELNDGLEARLEKNGSIGIYGSNLPISGNVSTSSDADAALLEKARKNADKNKLLFVIPAPVVVENGKEKSNVPVYYELKDKRLTVVAKDLLNASYPLSIDPSVYVQSAAQLMRGNNETNVEFDIATEQFKKGTTTGARIDKWTDTTSMNNTSWDASVAAYGGYIYRAGGRTGSLKPEIVDKKTTTLSTTSLTFAMDMPDTRPMGDLYIAVIAHDVNGTNTITAPTGWTTIQEPAGREHGVYYRYTNSVGTENASFTWTKAGNAVQWAGTILRIRNFTTSGGLPVISSTTANSGTNVTPTFPAITPTVNNGLLLRAFSADDDTILSTYVPTNHTDVAYGMSGGATGVGFAVAEYYNPPPSGTAVAAETLTNSGVSDTYGSTSLIVAGITVTATDDNSLQWAHINSTDGSIESPAPGSNGTACSGWCTNSVYNLPTGGTAADGVGPRAMQLLAYNGYLYAFGGTDGSTLKSTGYVAKLGANGEPQLWHPSDSNQANWVYWYKIGGSFTPNYYMQMTIHNGKFYSAGGKTTLLANGNAGADVYYADILPNGLLGNFGTTTSLPSRAYGGSLQAYNGYLYYIGGNIDGTMLSNNSTGTVYYNKIKPDGSIGTWNHAAADGSATGFKTPRFSNGGQMAGIWGGYLYLAGGCSAVNGNGHCTATTDDVQLASINADGTLDSWNTILNLKDKRFGGSFIAWQDSLYRFGGCGYQDQGNGTCYDTHQIVQYGRINQDGDASTVSVTSPEGQGLCQGLDPFDCNLPPPGTNASQGGQMLSSTAILNGFLYNFGGCTNVGCTTTSNNVSYTAIDSTGKLKRPPTCPYSTYGSWCVDDTTATGTGIAAASVLPYNGYLYIVGGLTGGGQSNQIYRVIVNADGSLTGPYVGQAFNTVGLNAYNTNGLSYSFAYIRGNPGGTNPANLYIFGGCTDSGGGAGCTGNANSASVYKCDIAAAGPVSACTTTGQLQITQVTGSTAVGLALHAGTVYANYIYLMGGVAPGALDLKTIRYAKFDNNNNVVPVSGSDWIESNVQMSIGRRRGTAIGYNGYIYAVGGFEATVNKPLDTIEFAKINVSNGSLESDYLLSGVPTFKQSAVTISQRWGLAIAISNSYAYVLGGCGAGPAPGGCTAFDPTVQTFQLYNNNSGTPSIFTEETNVYSGNRLGSSAAVYNGYIYVAGGCSAGGTSCSSARDDVEFAPIDDYGNIGTWTTTSDITMPGKRGFGQLEIVGNTLYWIGGYAEGGAASADVYYGTIGSGGDVASWLDATTGHDIPEARGEISAAVWNGRIYVTGGYTGTAYRATTYISGVMTGGGGTLNWTTSGSSFNTARSAHVTMTYANNLYVVGGNSGTRYLNDVQFAKINSDGTIGSWTFSTSLPFAMANSDGFAVNGYMYMMGGRSSASDCTARSLVAPISANTTISSGNNPTGIGEWYQTNRTFSGGKYGNSAAYYNGKTYVLGGGCQGLVMYDDFNTGIDSTQWAATPGMISGTACQSTSSSNVMYTNNGAATNYALTKQLGVPTGGTLYFRFYSPSADTGTCFRRENDTGLIGIPTNVEDVVLACTVNGGSSYTTVQTFAYNGDFDPFQNYAINIPAACQDVDTQFRWIMNNGEANDSFALEDVYVIANNDPNVQFTSPVSKASLLSQPQVASYTRLIDAGKDVFPTKWLMNGIDNSIGARWQMSYKSMNDGQATIYCGTGAMTSYGQATNFGDVTLGNPENYIVKDAGGTDIKCSRYFFITVSIDASKTFGYPEDINRGPTIDNITLFFKSNPGSRLLHGKTFIEGQQQPLDTQPGGN